MEVVTLREFARRVGVSLTAIQKGVKTGRVVAITDPATGKITGIDFASQGEAWTANSKHPQKRPHTIGGGRPRNDGEAPSAPAAAKSKPKPPDAESTAPKSGMPLADIQRARELVKLQLDNLKLREAQGELVRVAVVKSDMARLAASVKSGLMNIPDRVASQIAGMTEPHEIHALITGEINNAIEQLGKAQE